MCMMASEVASFRIFYAVVGLKKKRHYQVSLLTM